MLVLKPRGRGNWAELHLRVTGAHLPFLTVQPGQTVVLGGVIFRVCEVRP